MLYSPSIDQNGFDLRSNRSSGRFRGIRKRPSLSVFSTLPMRVDDNIGKYVRRSRSRKSKMLWRAGCVPVLNDDHATGETEGNVVANR